MSMKSVSVAVVATVIAALVSLSPPVAADDNYSVSPGNQASTVKTPEIDRTEKPEPKQDSPKTDTNYDVKKTHDEHIPATEKAAGEAAKRNNN